MKKIVLILSLFFCALTYGQNEAANWFFGENAGIKFDADGNLIGSVNGGQLNTREGCTSISDSNGDLLFYTDGTIVYNRNHEIMPNGTGLFGDSSSTQSALVVPLPGSTTMYYIFTVDSTGSNDGTDFGFNYSTVDMTLDGGFGDIVTKNINLLGNCSEKITAVKKDCQSESIWVLTFSTVDGGIGFNTSYHAFEVTTVGVNTSSVVSTFPPNVIIQFDDPRGQIKVSPDGTKFVSANIHGGLYLFDFDPDTGIVSNQQPLIINSLSPFAYGVEFSQNSELLYVHSSNDAQAGGPASFHQSTLTQFNLEAADIQASEFTVDQRQLYRGSLQLGPDGKIYRTLSENYFIGLPFLSVINNPNELGAGSNYIHNAVDLSPNASTQGLPPFITSFFNDRIDIIQNGMSTTELSLCTGETYMLMYQDVPGAVYTWYQDGVLLAESDYDLLITQSGVYNLHIEFNNGDCETFDGEAIVSYFEIPVANTADNINVCDDDNNAVWSFDFTAQDTDVLGSQDSLIYEVKYFESQADADNNENEIIGSYDNISNPQEIFVRIQNVGHSGCYDTISFMVEVFDTPIATALNDIEVCDDALDGDQLNGQVTTDLLTLNTLVLNGQDAAQFDITYHNSQVDADTGANALPNTYYNVTPNLEEIFVRIENNQNTDCNDTTSFNLIVHNLPTANPVADFDVCDDDNDGSFSFDFSTFIDADVLGSQNAATFNVHYFETQNDALNNVNELAMPYQTITNPQEIFVRIDNNDSADCYDTTSFIIEIFDTPLANALNDIETCDDGADGDAMNGQAVTDLGSLNSLVLNGQDDTQFSVTYHSSQVDADTNTNPLLNLYYNTTPFLEEIFVRIENNDKTDCYDTSSFNIITNPIPEAFDALLFQCDEDGNPDGFTLFNLTEANSVITGGVSDRSTKFYLTFIDAQNDTNEIDGTNYSNIVNPQIIQVRVINDITGCYNFSELTLDVSATNANDAQLEHCDDDGTEDGYYEFTLSDADATVLSGLPVDVTLNYYETYEDALLEVNPLNNLFTNTIAYFQTIYVRVENDNACYGINQVELTVYEIPNIETEYELIYCLNTYPELITLTAGLLEGIPSDYTYLWSTGDISSEIQINEPGTYSVTVFNSNNCSKLRTITVLPSNIATIDAIEIVDATSNNSITVLVSGEGDYEFALDDINGPYQDSNVFEDVPPGLHTVYIRDKNDCGIVDDNVSVIGFPKFLTPNGDGYHDTWQVYGVNHNSQFESIIYIFDRYGKLLKQLSPQSTGWDGTFNGQELPSSDYWFHVTLQDGRTFNSHFTLKH